MFIGFQFSKKDTNKLVDNFRKIRYQRMIDWTEDFLQDEFMPFMKKTQMSGQKVNDKDGKIFSTIVPYAVKGTSSNGGVVGGLKLGWLAKFLNNPHPIKAKENLMTVPLTDKYKSYQGFKRGAGKKFQLRRLGVVNGKQEYIAGVGTRTKMKPYYLLKSEVNPKKSKGFIDDAILQSRQRYMDYISDKIKVYFK